MNLCRLGILCAFTLFAGTPALAAVSFGGDVSAGPNGPIIAADSAGIDESYLQYNFSIGGLFVVTGIPRTYAVIPMSITYASYTAVQRADGDESSQAFTDLLVGSDVRDDFSNHRDCQTNFTGGDCGPTGRVTKNFNFAVAYTDDVGDIHSYGQGYVSLVAHTQGSRAQSWIDPVLTIDPTYAATNHLTLTFDDLGALCGGSPTPEPGVWWMMILGFGLAGGALRGRVRIAA